MPDTGLPDIPPPGAPSEPVLTRGTVAAFVTSMLVLFVAFGIDISDSRQAAILGVIGPAAVLVAAIWARAKAWSPRTVRQLVQKVRAEERGRRAAKTTADADIRDVKPGWLPGDLADGR